MHHLSSFAFSALSFSFVSSAGPNRRLASKGRTLISAAASGFFRAESARAASRLARTELKNNLPVMSIESDMETEAAQSKFCMARGSTFGLILNELSDSSPFFGSFKWMVKASRKEDARELASKPLLAIASKDFKVESSKVVFRLEELDDELVEEKSLKSAPDR